MMKITRDGRVMKSIEIYNKGSLNNYQIIANEKEFHVFSGVNRSTGFQSKKNYLQFTYEKALKSLLNDIADDLRNTKEFDIFTSKNQEEIIQELEKRLGKFERPQKYLTDDNNGKMESKIKLKEDE